MFKKLFSTIVFLVVLVGGGFYFYNQQPCVQLIHYKIGTFDKRFGLSQTVFRADVQKAGQIWSKDLGKQLFVYDPNGALSINLIYDSRQANQDKNATIATSISQNSESADSVRAQYLALEIEYKQYLDEYNALLAQKKDFNAIEAKRLQVNSVADQVNALVKKYNYLVNTVNANINTVNQSAGKEFEEGEYVYDQNGKRINIYEFKTNSELVRVLAHELGHSLGLDHNPNPKSIMYYLNQSTNEVPTVEDTTALKAICHTK
jgi:predicted Zn-dependent protease